MDEREIIGTYNDGRPMYENPTEQEILDHWDEFMSLVDREQREVLGKMRDAKILTFFRDATKGKTLDEAIKLAIEWWYQQYPWEVKPFLRDITLLRETQYNAKGFSADKNMMLLGRMPQTIRGFLLTYDPEFFTKDASGRSKNVDKFYGQFKAGKISNV